MSTLPTYSPRPYEYVYLISDDLEEVVPSTVDATLDQSDTGVRSRITIFNGSYLGVRRKGPRQERHDYWINLAFLDPRPTRRGDRFWSISAAILAIVTACALSVSYSQTMIALGLGVTVTIVSLSAATLLSVALAVRRYWGKLFFLTRHGRVPVLCLSVNRPDRKCVREFILAIQAAIARASADRADVSRAHHLRDEMKEHRRLQHGGVLDERQFKIARRLILGAHD